MQKVWAGNTQNSIWAWIRKTKTPGPAYCHVQHMFHTTSLWSRLFLTLIRMCLAYLSVSQCKCVFWLVSLQEWDSYSSVALGTLFLSDSVGMISHQGCDRLGGTSTVGSLTEINSVSPPPRDHSPHLADCVQMTNMFRLNYFNVSKSYLLTLETNINSHLHGKTISYPPLSSN